jgi:iron complex outermembrane receptor protein
MSGFPARHIVCLAVFAVSQSCHLSVLAVEPPSDAPPARASSTEDRPIEMKDVIISSTRLPDAPVDARTLPTKATVITAEDIRRAGVKTVQEAIQWATGIVFYDQVGNNFQQTIDLRGFNGQPVPSTSVFVDGQRINEPDFNTVNFDLIPFETIERIEILPGTAAIYGKNALGGVINIITKRGGDQHQVTGETLFGSFSRQRYTINASGPVGKLDYYSNFSRETEQGFRDDASARISRYYGRLGYRPTEHTDVTLSYTYVNDKLFQAGSLPISIADVNPKANFTPGDFFASETNVLRMTARQTLPLGFSLNVNGSYRHLNQQQFTASQPFFPGGDLPISNNNVHTESWAGTFQAMHDGTPLGHQNSLVLGVEVGTNQFANDFFSQAGSFTSTSKRVTNEDILGLYAQDRFHLLSNLILTAGVRYDHDQIGFISNTSPADNNARIFHRTNPRAGLTYLITPQTSAYFNYSQGFRVPTFLELFALGPFGSNPNLKPVTSRNYEVGVKSQVGDWSEISLALFRIDVDNEILLVCGEPFTCGVTTFATNQNIPKSRRQGFEATVKARYKDLIDGIVNYTYTQATIESDLTLNPFFFDAFGSTPYIEQVKKGSTFPQVPKNRLSVTTNYHPAHGWTLSLIGLYVSTQFLINDEQNTRPRLPGYFVLNSRAAYERPVPGGRMTGFLMFNNMLNQNYFTSGVVSANNLTGGGAVENFVVPAPGLAVYGGLTYRFEGFGSRR